MKVDPRFSLSVETRDEQTILRAFAAADAAIAETATFLFEASFGELCDLALVGARERRAFEARDRTIFCNGWQSWSYGGELAAGERVRRARIVPNIAVFCDGPGPLEARGEVLSRFIAYVRAGEGRLVVASVGSPDKATAPVSFRIHRLSLAFRVELNANGGRFAAGELVAELRLFYREGYFAAKDALHEAFRGYRHFDRLAFLGANGSLVPGGYESWYNHYTRIDDAIIERDLSSIGANDNLINSYYLRRGKPTVFQIDDGWEKAVGQWEPDAAKFPRGMKVFAEEIEAMGMIPGIWIAPFLVTRGSAVFRERPDWILRDGRGRPVPAGFNPGWDGVFYCLDISLGEVEDYLGGIFARLTEEWGYRYLKLDFLYAAFIEGAPKRRSARGRGARTDGGVVAAAEDGADSGATGDPRAAVFARGGAAYEHYDRVIRRLTSRTNDSRGRGIVYLGCGAPLESSFRYFPLMRIGADTKEQWEDDVLKYVVRHQGRPAAYTNLSHTIGRSILDGTVFVNDPDVVFCRTSRMGLSEAAKELIALVDFMLASQIMFSDDTHEFGEAGELAFTSRVVALYDALAGREYGAQRSARDAFRIFSRDGKIEGLVNLSNRPHRENAALWTAEKVVAGRAERKDGAIAFAPRSITLFEK